MSSLTLVYVLLTAFYALTSHKTLNALKAQGAHAKEEAKARDEQFAQQFKVSRDAADAALMNAQAVINAERAWVTAQVHAESWQMFGNPAVVPWIKLAIVNSGRTHAKITHVMVRFMKRLRVDNLPPVPDFAGLSPMSCDNFILASGNHDFTIESPIESGLPLPTDDVIAIRDRKSFLLAYGFISYLDVFDKLHKTYFCFYYVATSPADHGFQACFEAPASYRISTDE
jgi:hypothetical protein